MSDEQEKTSATPDTDQSTPNEEQTPAVSETPAVEPEQPVSEPVESPPETPVAQETAPPEPPAELEPTPESAKETPAKAASFIEKQRLRAVSAEPVPQLTPEAQPTEDTPSLGELDQDIESEIEAAMGGMSDKEMYGESTGRQRDKKEGARSKGNVISIHGQDVFVDVPGSRSQGMLSMTQFPDGPPKIGDEIEVTVDRYDQENGLLILNRRGEAINVDWSSVSTGTVVEARVTGTNKGGLTVEVNRIRGFMPISQIDIYRVENADEFVNQKLKCLVTEVNPQERNLVVSRRALLEQEREEQREKLWESLEVGQTRDGVVRSVRNFGAFVDIGGVDGLLHVSEMSWAHVEDPGDVVQPGQTVKVKVLKIDPARRKISLGLKQLASSPWDAVDEKYPLNAVVHGKVTRLMNFGAFVELEPGVEGLIHISELGDHRVNRVGDVVQVGQELDVMVLRVDRQQQRIGLSLRAAQADDAEGESGAAEEYVEHRPRPSNKEHLRGGIGD